MGEEQSLKNSKLARWQIGVLVGFFLICLAVRLAFFVQHCNGPLWGDEVDYDSIAYNLMHGHGFARDYEVPHLTASRPPIYPLYLVLIYSIFGHSLFAGRLATALVELGSCFLLLMLARTLAKGFWVPALAVLGYAVNPVGATYAKYLIAETLFVFLFLLMCLLTIVAYQRRSLLLYASAGVSAGLATLCRPNLVGFPIFFLIGVLLHRTVRKQVLVWGIAAYLLMVAVTISPWTVRNYLVFHKFIPIGTMGGVPFWCGTSTIEGDCPTYLGSPGVPKHVLKMVAGKSEPEMDRLLYKEGLRVIKQNPTRYAWLCVRKVFRLWFNLLYNAQPSKASLAVAAFNLVLWILAIIGYRHVRENMSKLLMLVTIAHLTVLHIFTYASARYALPAYAYLTLFAAVGFYSLVHREAESGTAQAKAA